VARVKPSDPVPTLIHGLSLQNKTQNDGLILQKINNKKDKTTV